MENRKPPIFKTWPQLYAFVLLMHLLVILSFWIFMRQFGAA